MKQVSKKLIFTVLMSMISTILFAYDIKANNEDGVTIWYNWINGKTELAVTSYGGYFGDIIIPESVAYNGETYKVTSIQEGAFRGCSGLTSVTIPNSVTSLGDDAFLNCSSLTSITIPNSVTSIEGGAFNGCSSLTSVTLSNGLTSIVDYLFYSCTGLNTISIPDGVTIIGQAAFKDCTNLTSITIPSSVTSIGDFVFQDCTSLTSIAIPNSVTSIGTVAFAGCTSLTSITIPSSVTSIRHSAFENCTSLTSITIPNSVTSIDFSAFKNCTSLTSISIPNSVTTIGSGAFSGCTSLISITIPNGVTTIDATTFSDCTSLASVTIPSSVTKIYNFAFKNCNNLTSIYSKIETPFELKTGKFSERDYKEATLYVPLGTSSRYKETSGWKEFENIEEIDYSEETEEPDDGKLTIHVAQAGTLSDFINENEKYQIKELTLTGEINGEDFRLLRNMAGKGTVFGNSFYDADTDGKLSVLDLSGVKIVAGGEYMRWDDGIDNDFGYYLIHDDEIPPSVFSGCIGLNSIKIPDNISVMGQSAFYGTSWYDSQPDGITYIGKVAYNYKGDMPENTQLTIKDGTLSIACSAFGGCKNLTSITIPNSVSVIGGIGEVAGPQDYYGAFKNCIGLTSITIPNSVTIIGKYTFDGCTALRSIKIGSGIMEIGSDAFANILKFNENTRSDDDYLHIYCEAEVAPTISPYAFSGTDMSRVVLHVPDNLIDEYKATETWSEIGTIEGLSETGINAIRYDVSKAQIFDLQGNKLDHVHKGLNIIRMNDGKVKKIFVK